MKKLIINLIFLSVNSWLYSQVNYTPVDSLIVYHNDDSSFNREYLSFKKLNRECFEIEKAKEEYSIYYDLKGYDDIEVSIGDNVVLDSIYSSNSIYHRKIFKSSFVERPLKNKILKVRVIDKLKSFQFNIKDDYNSIVIIPHIDEQLITGYKQAESDLLGDEILEQTVDYIEIHLLNFNYYEFVIAKKECGF